MRSIVHALVGAAALAAFAATGAAMALDRDAPGRAVSRSFAPLPTPLTLRVSPLDDTDENLALGQRIVAELGKRGASVQEHGPTLVLSFDSEIRRAGTAGPSRGLGRSSAAGELSESTAGVAGTIGREDERVANMWSSTQDSVLTGPPRAGAPLPPRYVINATIDDGANGRRLWQGHVSYTGVELREAETLAAMVPFLLDTLDKNVREQGFRLP